MFVFIISVVQKYQSMQLSITKEQQNSGNIGKTSAQVPFSQKKSLVQSLSFKGTFENVSGGLNFLTTYPAAGALVVAVAAMDLPRTVIDSTRGRDAGIETGIREFSSEANFSLVGAWGVAAAWLFGNFLNNKYNGVNAKKIFADGETIDFINQMFHESKGNKTAFVNNFVGSLQTLNGSKWNNVKDTKEISGLLQKVLDKDYVLAKADSQRLIALITSETGGNQLCKVKIGDKEIKNSLTLMLDNFVSLGRSFVKMGKETVSTDFVKSLKGNKKAASILGLAIPILIAVSTQPINRWLTKLRTGKEGFVGVKGEQADSSGSFITKKVIAAGAMCVLGLSQIGNLKEIFKKIQFSGIMPNVSQFKFIYTFSLMSRMLVARDTNELRETCIKDVFGFLNWLVLGGFVSKLVANAQDKSLMNYDSSALKADAGGLRKGWHWITNATVKSSEEILYEGLKKCGKSTNIMDDNGKLKPFRKLLQELPEAERMKISKVNKAQLAGYAYSMFALGIGVPLLNIFITNKLHKKGSKNTGASELDVKKLNPYFMHDKTVQKMRLGGVSS